MSPTKKISYIYNPDRQSPEELISSFVIRLKEFKDIFADIKGTPPSSPAQHYIIQGPRGTGKTTLLLRLFYEIQNDRKLKKKIIPVIFSEEQYHIVNLCRLWESAVEYLDEHEEFSGLYNEFEKAMDAEDYEDRCFGILAGALAKSKKKLVLLIDNIGDLLRRFSEEEHHRLREILLTSSEIRIVGASSVTLEYTFDYSEPFFEFFKLIHISGLDKEETNALLLSLGKNYNEAGIQKIMEEQPERIEILRRLTGGIPRTIILLFEIFADDRSGDSFKDLEIILDRVTPLYKHRMEDLSRQQQQIVDALAMSWDAVSTKELAEKVRLDSKLVSAQLKQLEKNRIVHKIETDTKNYLYQITERFFNIWYLMRHGRRKDRNRVLWLVKFLKEWCGKEELVERAKRHLACLGKEGFYPGHAYIMTEALARADIPWELQDELIGKTKDFLNKKDKTLMRELSKSDIQLYKEAGNAYKEKVYNKCLHLLEKINSKNSRVYYAFGLVNAGLDKFAEAEKNYLIAVVEGNVPAMFGIAFLYKGKNQLDKAEKYYLMAVEKGDSDAMNNLADLYKEQKQFDKAERYFLMAVEKENAKAMNNLADLYKEQKQFDKAEKYYLSAVEKGQTIAIFELANLYGEQGKNQKAEKYYLMAIEKGYVEAMNNLTFLYLKQKTNKEKALQYMLSYYENFKNIRTESLLTLILLWNNEFEQAQQHFVNALSLAKKTEDYFIGIQQPLLLMIAKQQYYSALKFFEDKSLNFKERYKPLYYALMYFMKDEYPNEYLKMGAELKETVDEIVKEIEQMSVDYA